MKKWLCALLALLLVLSCYIVFAEQAPTASFKKTSFPTDAEYIDLEKITVGTGDMDAFYAFLAKFPNLKKVDMFSTRIGRLRIEALTSRFPDIEFGMTMVLAKHEIRTDATAFSTLHGYETFEHNTIDFSILKYCKNLYALDVGHNLINDLSILYELPKLRVLILAGNQINDITPIASLKDLEYLEIFKNDVHNIEALSELPHLVDLNITSNRIKDLSPLQNVKTLRRLWILNSNAYSQVKTLDPVQVLALREALPDTYIDEDSAGTEGGWREGHHYDVIYEMFNTAKRYIPFNDVKFDSYAYDFVE